MNVVRNSFFPSFLQKPLTLLRKIPIFQRFEESVFTSYVSHGKLVGADTFGNTYYEQSQPETTAHCNNNSLKEGKAIDLLYFRQGKIRYLCQL